MKESSDDDDAVVVVEKSDRLSETFELTGGTPVDVF